MRILYLSDLFSSFIHYPIVELTKENPIEFFVYFFQNRYTYYRDNEHKKFWSKEYLSVQIDRRNYKIIKYWGLPKDLLKNLYWMSIFLQIKIKNNYDIIHANCLYPAGYIAMKLAKKNDIPFVVTTHGSDFYSNVNFKFNKYYNSFLENQIQRVLIQANAILAVSKNFANDIKKYCPESKVRVIENTYNSTIFQCKSKNKLRKGVKFISVGNFIPLKNHLVLLKAFKKCREHYDDITLTLIGRGPLRNEYLKYINQNNLGDSVKVLDFLPQHLLVHKYNCADIFVLPSNMESFGIVILEAFACGLPVIASKTNGPLSIIDNDKNGLLFEINNLKELILQMEFFIKNRSKISEMGSNAIDKANDYKKKYNDIYDVYKEILARE